MTTFPSAATLASKTFANVDGAGMTHRAWMAAVGVHLNHTYDAIDLGCAADGATNDTTALNNALTTATGGVLYLPKGTGAYMVQGITVPADTTMVMAPGAVLKKRTNGTLLTVNARSNLVGCHFDGNSGSFTGVGVLVNTSADDAVIRDCSFTAMDDLSISGTGSASRVKIINNLCNNTGIGMTNCDDVLIDGNTVLSTNTLAPHSVFVGSSGSGSDLRGGRIVNNHLVCPTTYAAGITAGAFNSANAPTNMVIANNTFIVTGSGVGSHISLSKLNDSVCTGNTCDVTGSGVATIGGIEVVGCFRCVVSSNRVNNPSAVSSGIIVNSCTDCSVNANTITGPLGGSDNSCGIMVYADSVWSLVCSRNVVSNNTIVLASGSTANGIVIYSNAATATCSGNIITGNIVTGLATLTAVAYAVYSLNGSAVRNRVENNNATNMTTGIRLYQDDQTRITDDNHFVATGLTDIVYAGGTTNLNLTWSGTGSPNSVYTALIGSTFRRTDGGASTSFYVKESGTSNTGWTAK